MRILVNIAVVLLVVGAIPARAQSAGERPFSAPARLATLSGGVGNALGWYGLEGEWFLAGGSAAVFVGAGYTPRSRRDDPSGLTGSAGVRVFTPGVTHRGFGEVSFSQIGLERASVLRPGGRQIYGPGAQIGYEYLARSGLTLALSGGLGYGLGIGYPANKWQPMLGLACGYTWRSRRGGGPGHA